MPKSLSPAELEVAVEVGFDRAVLDLIRSQTDKRIERLQGQDNEGELLPARGLSVLADRQEVERLVESLRPQLAELGYRAFWSERREPNGLRDGDELAVLLGTDPYAIISVKATDGANYGVFAADIVEKLRVWEAISKFEVLGAGFDWVALRFTELPEDLCGFAAQVYELCPDTVEQGVGLVSIEQDPELHARARELCPEDPVPRGEAGATGFLAHLEQQRGNAKTDAEREILARLEQALGGELRGLLDQAVSAGHEESITGIRLLAAELERSRYLFLWWD